MSKNSDCLVAHDAAIELFNAVLAAANNNRGPSCEHLSADGTDTNTHHSKKIFLPRHYQCEITQ